MISSLKRNCQVILSVLFTFTFVFGSYSFPVNSSVSEAKAKQQQIEADLKKIEESFKVYEGRIHEYEQQTTDLQEQLASLDAEAAQLQANIEEINRVIEALNEEERILKNESDALIEQMVFLAQEYQRVEKISPIQVFLTTGNFSETFATLNSFYSIETQARDLQEQLDAKQAEIDENKERSQRAVVSLEKSQIILENRKVEKRITLERTQGRQEEFEKLLAEAEAIQAEEEAQLQIAIAEVERQEELERQRAAAAAAAQNSGGSSSGGGSSIPNSSSSSCYFLDGRQLNVPAGYFRRPSDGFITRGIICQASGGHDALDIGYTYGSNLYAIADGTVVRKGFNGTGYGHFVVIRHDLPSGQKVYSLYAHMTSASPIANGGFVSKGSVVGYMGCTGNTRPRPCGVHLHFMMMSDTYERGGVGCRLNSSQITKCYNPLNYISY